MHALSLNVGAYVILSFWLPNLRPVGNIHSGIERRLSCRIITWLTDNIGIQNKCSYIWVLLQASRLSKQQEDPGTALNLYWFPLEARALETEGLFEAFAFFTNISTGEGKVDLLPSSRSANPYQIPRKRSCAPKMFPPTHISISPSLPNSKLQILFFTQRGRETHTHLPLPFCHVGVTSSKLW